MKILISDSFIDTIHHAITSKPILLTTFSLAPILSAITEFLKIPFLGFNVGIFTFLFLVIMFDMYTGIKAAVYTGDKLTSRKGLRSLDKLVSYFFFIVFTALLQSLLDNQGYSLGLFVISNLNILLFILIFLWEFHSIGENYEKRYGRKPKMFTLMDKISKIIEKKVINKIENLDSSEQNEKVS
jgi:phage-related holin